jgi:signal transduction histidine kinase/ActR/RegA family two-component response regulator
VTSSTQASTTESSRPGHGTLRRKLFLIVMVAALAAMVTSMGGLLVYEALRYRQAGIEDLRAQADLVSKSLAPTLLFNDPKAAAEALRTLQARPDILAAAVFLPDNSRFANYRAPGAGERVLPQVPGTASSTQTSATELAVSQPITGSEGSLGTLYLQARLDLPSRMVGYGAVLALAALPGLALAALIFRRLHPQVTRPILAIEAASRRVMDERRYDISVGETSDGEIGRLIDAFNSMVRDLSVQMQERRAAEGALREADRRKDEFLATLAHELRNPLAPIMNAVALLDRAADNPALRTKATAIIRRQTSQMARLIDDLLEVSRITRGKLELRMEVVDAVAVVRTAYEAAEPTLSHHAHEVELVLPPDPIHVRADAARLMQVVVNLLTNAAKYTPRGGRVQLRVTSQADEAAIIVRDSGVGIAPEHRARVFDMFFQVDQSLERGPAGLGVGLTIAAQLIAMHNGRIDLDSEGPGRGSEFTVRLPLAPAPVTAAPSSDPAANPPGAPGAEVLVADDNVDFADSLATLLRAEGHAVHAVHDGAAAWAFLERQWPQVAFLDVGMPGLNGLALARRIRERAGDRPMTLVAITGWGQAADRQRVLEAGFDLHWVKPIDPMQALQLLRSRPAGVHDVEDERPA